MKTGAKSQNANRVTARRRKNSCGVQVASASATFVFSRDPHACPSVQSDRVIGLAPVMPPGKLIRAAVGWHK